jgi:hypothetical protein
MKKDKKKASDKFRQRIAFNLVKECILGKDHNPFEPQVKILKAAIKKSDFVRENGQNIIDLRTYENGWLGKSRPQLRLQGSLDEIIIKLGKVKLNEWTKREQKNQKLHNIALPEAMAGITPRQMSYLPGVDTQPSRWIKREAINDVLHEHLNALDVLSMDCSFDNIDKCNNFLYKIHFRWDPHGKNYFFKCMDFNQDDFIHFDDADYKKQYIGLHGNFDSNKDCFDPSIIVEFKSPENIYQTYDVFSPAKINEFLLSIPISTDITEHPLLEFWTLEFASATAAFIWLVEAYHTRDAQMFIYEQTRKTLDTTSFGHDLFWRDTDIQQCLCKLNIFHHTAHYERYYDLFNAVRNQYRSTLLKFGINISEIQLIVKNFHDKNVKIVYPKNCKEKLEREDVSE